MVTEIDRQIQTPSLLGPTDRQTGKLDRPVYAGVFVYIPTRVLVGMNAYSQVGMLIQNYTCTR